MEGKNEKLMEETLDESVAGIEPRWKKWLGFFTRYILPMAFTVLLLIYLFHIVNFDQMLDYLKHGVNYWWILLAMVISVFSHIFRALRWQLQLNALNIRPPFMALCCSIFGCYALNLVFPRLGEIWRCTYVAGYKKNSFSAVLGSMLGDRAADFPLVGLLIVLTLIVAAPAISSFLDKYPVGFDFVQLFSQYWFWISITAGVALMVLVFRLLRRTPMFMKLGAMLKEVWGGLIVIGRMPGKWKFVLYTFCLWGCYYVQLYVAFYAFSFTRTLCFTEGYAGGLVPCLVAFVLSSISMLIPSNGGLGPWNLAIMFALSIYGVTDTEGTAFSMVQWTGNTVMLILLGIFTMIYISLSRPRNLKLETKIKNNPSPYELR